jgi:hypothetical protein
MALPSWSKSASLPRDVARPTSSALGDAPTAAASLQPVHASATPDRLLQHAMSLDTADNRKRLTFEGMALPIIVA